MPFAVLPSPMRSNRASKLFVLYYTGEGTGRQLKARIDASGRALLVMAGYHFLKQSTQKSKSDELMLALFMIWAI